MQSRKAAFACSLQQLNQTLSRILSYMTPTDITSHSETFNRLIDKCRIHDAINMVKTLAEQSLAWEISDEIKKIDDSYRYLLQYAVDGVDDPGRNDIYKQIVASLDLAFNRLVRKLKMQNATTGYYVTARRMGATTLGNVIEAYRRRLKTADAFSNAISGVDALEAQKQIEQNEIDIFDRVWTSYPLVADDTTCLANFITDDATPRHIKILTISALMLGLLDFADNSRLKLLAEIYSRTAGDEILGPTALTCLVLGLYLTRNSRHDSSTEARIDALKDIPSLKSDLRIICMELIRTRDTERLTRSMTNEIVPGMQKIKPEIEKRMAGRKVENLDINDIEDNPEWQELLDKSGIADKIKELFEAQEEGGDIMMASFSHLKSAPFFYTVANWFMPFHTGHSLLGKLGENGEAIGSLIGSASFMCDSDKYSSVLLFGSIDKKMKDMMLSNFNQHVMLDDQVKNSTLNLAPDRRRHVVNKYVQNLYRFFFLFRRKDDFTNPFAGEINLTEVKFLRDNLVGDEILSLVAEFYFSHKYYKEALGVFNIIDTYSFPDATRYQKTGLCYQRLGDIDNALSFYERAELLNADSLWTIRRLAACCRLSGNFERALGYYRRIEEQEPESAAVASHIGNCLLMLDRFDEAVKAFYKADYLSGSTAQSLRRLAWAQLCAGSFDAAAASYGKLIAGSDTTAEDFLNAGHLSLAVNNLSRAVDNYSACVRMHGNKFTLYLNSMRADTPTLLKLGINPDIIPLIIDSVAYRTDS